MKGSTEALLRSTPTPSLSPQGGEEPRLRSKSNLRPRHGEMKDDIRTTYALRLGFRQISGMAEDDGLAIARARGAGFDSIRDLWLRARLKPSVLERLANADAFRSLGLDRRAALWAVRALQRSGDKDDLPLLARVAMPEQEPDVALPPMCLGEHVVEDYRHLNLSLKAHPVSFIRADLARRGVLRHEEIAGIPSGSRVTVAGLVLVRQRPGSASGVIFMTLEDETTIANVIVWPRTFEAFRPVVLGARLISVTGKLQNESDVIHVVADRLDDLTPLLRRLSTQDVAVAMLAHCDEVKRPDPGYRSPKHQAQQTRSRVVEATEASLAAVMPKGRNFH